MDDRPGIRHNYRMAISPEFSSWLSEHALAAYTDAFEAEGVDLDVVGDLIDADLKLMGLTLGDRKRFVRAVAELGERRNGSRSATDSAPIERRNLSVLFCDLVGSTVLVNRMDAEEYASLVTAYSRACRDAIVRAGGTVAKFTGDGLMAYFGYPVSHGDEAARAISAGLDIQAGVAELSTQYATDLGARVGIATGLTIVGNVFGDATDLIIDAVGNTPNLASRIETNAIVGSVTVSDLTRRLAGAAFDFEQLEPTILKGFVEPHVLHRVRGARARALSFEGADTRLIGRSRELATMHEELALSLQGSARGVVLVGEPGVGKSHLVAAFGAAAEAEGWSAFHFSCADQGQSLQAHPLRRALADAARLQLSDDDATRNDKLRELAERVGIGESADIIAGLFGRSDATGATPTDRRRALFEGVGRLVIDAASRHPLLVVVEDSHWADATTLALIDHVFVVATTLPVLVVMTTRPTERDVDAESLHGLSSAASITTVHLEPFDETDGRALIEFAAGQPVEPSVVDEILRRSDGLPLYLDEVTRALVDRCALTEVNGILTANDGDATLIPATLYDGLSARLDRLPTGGKLAPIAAALGRSFSVDLLFEVAPGLDVATGVQELLDAQLFDRGDVGTIRFRHALIRDAAYERMLRPERRAVHERAARALVDRFPATAATLPHQVANHFAMSADPTRSVFWWLRAADLAAHHSANVEVVASANAALAVLASHPVTNELLRLELDLQLLLAGALRGVAGFAAPVTGQAYARARELCDIVGETERLLTVLNGVYSFHLVRDEYDLAENAAHDLLGRANQSGRQRDAMIANRAVGAVAFHTGRLLDADRHLAESVRLYGAGDFSADRFVYGTDHASTASVFLALTRWVSGQPRSAVETSEWAIEHAHRLDHPHSWAQAVTYRCFLAAAARDWSTMAELAPLLIDRAERNGLAMMAVTGRFWAVTGAFFLGDRLAIVDMAAMSEAWWNTGGRSYLCFRNTLLAEAHSVLGQVDRGLRLIDVGLERIAITNERWSEAEAHRVRARLLMMSGLSEEAQQSISLAITVADRQGAQLWALRAEVERMQIGREGPASHEDTAAVRRRAAAIDGDETCIDLREAALLGS